MGREITLANALAQASGAPIEVINNALKEDKLPHRQYRERRKRWRSHCHSDKTRKRWKIECIKRKIRGNSAKSISVNGVIVRKAAKKDPFSPALSDAATLILHELAHWLYRHYNINASKDRKYEAGYEFEKIYHGVQTKVHTELP